MIDLSHNDSTPRRPTAWTDSSLLDQIDTAIYAVDGDGICRRFNIAAQKLFGYSQDEALGQNMHDLLHSRRPNGEPHPLEACQLLQTLRSGKSQAGLREAMWAKDGTLLSVECSVSRVEMDGIAGAVITAKDLRSQEAVEASLRAIHDETTEILRQRDVASRMESELAHAEALWQRDLALNVERVAAGKLREQQDLLSHVVEASPLGIAVLDSNLRLRWHNRAYLMMLRRTEQGPSLTGMSFHELSQTRPDVISIVERASRTREPYKELGCSFDGPDGGKMFWNCWATPLPGEDLLLTVQDVTEQSMSQQALVQSDKMASVGRLAASISHEITNPLEAVTNLLYLLHSASELSDESRNYVDMAESELARVSQIASQTLRFHRHAPQAVERTPQQLVEPVLALYQGKLKHAHVDVNLHHHHADPVTMHEGDVRQILNNLIGNAIDAMERGGKLTVRTCLRHCVRTGRMGLRVTISDSGHGMTAETARRIFEPFYTTKGASGSGLGLWISHTLAERHGGTLRVRSCKKDSPHCKWPGTTFSLFVPSETAMVQ